MTPLLQVQHLYNTYMEQAEEAEKNTPFASGIFGLGKRASDDPCHDRFIQNLTALMAQFKEEGIDSAALREVLAFVFQAHAEYQVPASTHWMLIAAHSTTLDVIPLLNREDAAALCAQYEKAFKRRERMPVQTKIVKLLNKAMK